MNPIQRLRENLTQFLTQPGEELSRVQCAVQYTLRLGIHCYQQLQNDRAPQIAAALTYRTLFSLLPTLALALTMLQAFTGFEEYGEQFKTTLVESMLPATLLQAELNEAPASATTQPATTRPATQPGEILPPRIEIPPARATTDGQTLGQVGAASPAEAKASQSDTSPEQAAGDTPAASAELREARAQLGERIQDLLDMLGNIDFRSIGIVSLFIFLYGATTLLQTTENAFNSIFGVDEGRPWYLRVTFYYTVITLGPMVLIAGQVLQQGALKTLEGGAWTNWLAGPLVVLSPVLTSWLVLLSIYVLLPHTRVKMRTAAVGSLVAAVLWVVTKELFAIYVARTAITSLYGAMALVPLFLMWLYLTWLIVLFGLELTYTLQSMAARQWGDQTPRPQVELLGDPQWVLPIMARLARGFDQGEALDPQSLADDLGLPAMAVSRFCTHLRQAGMIRAVQAADDSNTTEYVLAKSARQIDLTSLLDLSRSWQHPDEEAQDHPAWSSTHELWKQQRQAVAGQTLGDLHEAGPADQ